MNAQNSILRLVKFRKGLTVIFIVLLVLFALLLSSCESRENPSEYVNPNIGTAHSRWFFYTPASLPWGMAKPAPSTNGHYGNKYGWDAVGYDDRHKSIEGFVNTHEFQIGGISLMPTTGELITIPGTLEEPDKGYRSRFSKESEVATPGYYKVKLDDYNVTAELTASKRVAFHRYTFPANTDAHLIFDIGRAQGESGAVIDAMVKKSGDYAIEGWVRTEPMYIKKYQQGAFIDIYFSAKLDRKIEQHGMFKGDHISPQSDLSIGIGSGAYISFKTSEPETVVAQVAISYTSIENARKNLEVESTSFDRAKKNAEEIWTNELSKIYVEGGRTQDKVKFYTGLYHALLGRGLASDVNGAYPKNDGTIGQIPIDANGHPEFNFYNTDAIWGGFWNLTQLWALVWPEYYNDYVQSHLLVYKDSGWLGDGLANSRYVSGVGTNFVGLVIAAAHNVGIRNYDVDLAFEAALKNELGWKSRPNGAGKLDVKHFIDNNYIPHKEEWEWSDSIIVEAQAFSASHTLEYSFSAHAVAQFAKTLIKEREYQKLKQLSFGWENIFNEASGFIHPKDSAANFIKEFKPLQAWRGFQEGNSWQYSFYVPHHAKKLVEKIGKEEFNYRLDSIFLSSRIMAFGGGTKIDAFAGVETLYNQGNQPCLHIPWLYNFSGEPEKTQFWTRTICDEFYGSDPIHGYGYGQDEDQGQLGAWYVLASIGLFDVAGLTNENPIMQIGSPAFDRINIKLNQDYYSGKEIKIRVKDHSQENLLVKSAKLNGKTIKKQQVSFSELVNGALLEFEMKSSKNLYENE